MSYRSWAWLPLAVLVGCAGSGGEPLARDVARLQDEVRTLKAEREADRRRLDGLEARVGALSKSGAAATPRSLAIPEGLAVVRVAPGGEPDDEEGSAFIVDLGDEDSPRARPTPLPRAALGGPTGGVDAAPPLATEVELREPSQLSGPPPDYLAAEEALRAGDTARAAALFEAFVNRTPRDPRADNALVALGDAYVRTGDPARALAAYERVATEYPAGDAVPEALLRYGETCLELGRKAAARAAFRRVVEDHPGSAPAETAKGRLVGL